MKPEAGVMSEGVVRALEANRAAYDALRAGLRPGMTEREARELVREAVDRVCGAETHEFVGDFVGGVRAGAIEGPATDLVLKPGDVFLCDLSVRRGEAWSDTCRTFFLGEPTAAMRAAYEAILGVQRLGEETVRAGLVCEELKTKAEAFLAARGYAGRMPHHVGHRVGPKPYMKPAFEPGDGTALEEGWCVTLEPGLYFEGEFGIRVENDYLVGTEGVTDLFGYPRELDFFVLSGD